MEGEPTLINLNSPEQVHSIPCQTTYLKNPLIPSPDVNCETGSNNPFDYVAHCAEFWDPFEKVLHESLMKVENAQNDNPKSSSDFPVMISKSGSRSSPKKCETSTINPHKFTRSHSVSDNCRFFKSPSKKSTDSDSAPSSPESSSLLSTSLTEKIKNVVKRRVSKCIEKALRSSISQPELSQSVAPPACSPRDTLRINGGYSLLVNGTLALPTGEVPSSRPVHCDKSQYLIEAAASGGSRWRDVQKNRLKGDINGRTNISCDVDTLQCELHEMDMKDILKEAQNISMILKSIPKSPSRTNDSVALSRVDKESEDDLLAMKAPWEEEASGSLSSSTEEDSSIGLPRVKLFYTKKSKKKKAAAEVERKEKETSEVIEHFKMRILRASLDGSQSTCEPEKSGGEPKEGGEEEPAAGGEAKSQADSAAPADNGKKPEKEPKDPLGGVPAVGPLTGQLRPKKRGNILKKGPLRAIVPIQKMTKSIAGKISSPIRKNTFSGFSDYKRNIGSDRNVSSSGRALPPPVAASTPKGRERGSPATPPLASTPNSSRPLVRRGREVAAGSSVGSSRGQAQPTRRSASLSSESRHQSAASPLPQPFSSLNPNVVANSGLSGGGSGLLRPSSAPAKPYSPARGQRQAHPSPPSRDKLLNPRRRHISPVTERDKENRLHT